jgi:DNA-binding MarR family transcriptional regulator
MNELRKNFEEVQCTLMDLVDTINAQHKGGVDFGTGQRLYPAEIHTIEAIGNYPEITVTKLAELMAVSKPTISERINRLSRKGLVSKIAMADNAKAVPLILTESGKVALKGHEVHHQQMFDLFVQKYGDDAEDILNRFSFAFKEMRNLAEEFSCGDI